MASATLERVMEEVKAMTPDEQQQLRDALNELLANPQNIEYLLQKSLHESGLLSEIKPSRAGQTSRAFKPIEVDGKPVSETIIEERR
jgi:spore germination protein GerM